MDKVKGMEVIRDIIDTYDRCAEPGIGMVIDIGFNEEDIKSLIDLCNFIDNLEDSNEMLKDKICEKLQERKFELQQEYMDFEGDLVIETLENLLK